MLRCLFIRHGESANNFHARASGADSDNAFDSKRQPDPPIMPEAHVAGSYCAKWVKGRLMGDLGFTESDLRNPKKVRIVCSPFLRALESAECIRQEVPTQVYVCPEIGEIGGLFHGPRLTEDADRTQIEKVAGMTDKDVKALYPNADVSAMAADLPWWNRPQETRKEAKVRADLLLKRLSNPGEGWTQGLDPEGVLLFITHGLFFNLVLHTIFGKDNDSTFFLTNNWSASELQFAQKKVALSFHGLQHYLPTHLRRPQVWRKLLAPTNI